MSAVAPFPVPWRLPRASDSPVRVAVTHVTDPLCPWAYSYEPVLRTLEARYGDQLVFRTVLIGLVSTVAQSRARGSSPEGRALTALRFRRYGMPVTPHVRERVIASEPACLLVKAAARQGAADDGRMAVVPGFQPFEAADVALMNLEPRLRRLAVGDDALWSAA